MLRKPVFAILLVSLALAPPVLAQGEFLKGEESGLGASIGRAMGDDAPYNFSYTIAYSARRIADIGFTYASLEDYDGSAYAVSMTLHLLDQKPQQPLNLAFTSGYDWISLDDDQSSLSSGVFLLALSAYTNIPPAGNVVVQLAISGGAAIRTDASEEDIDMAASLGLAVSFNRNASVRPYVYGTRGTVGGESETVVGLGLVTAW